MRLLLPAAIALGLTAAAAISMARSAEVRVGDLEVTAWARATPPGVEIGVAYATIVNHGRSDDHLLAASTPAAGSVSLHQTSEENGVATMRPLDRPAIPAGGALAMEPGGTHLMLMGLAAPLKQGESVPLTLRFENAGEVRLQVPISPMGAAGPVDGHGDHAM